MGATDALLARMQTEVQERSQFMDGLVEGAQKDERDLTEQEMTLLGRARDRIRELEGQLGPIQEAAQIAQTSKQRTAQIAKEFAQARDPEAAKTFEYRSAGQYVLDYWRAGLGITEVQERLELYHRAAAHQTTADNPGLLPEQILGPVISFVDAARPLVSALGARQLPGGSWSRPKVTQHTSTGAQTTEKSELVSQKMTITKLPVAAQTIGGYVNVSRQDIDWSQPAIMDMVINDLAAQYAIDTEVEACGELTSAAPAGPTLPTGARPPPVAGALWGAAATVIAATSGQGRIFAVTPPSLMGLLGPLFPPVNPQNAQSAGFSTAGAGVRPRGQRGRDPRLRLKRHGREHHPRHLSSAAAEVYEDRIGSLQVVEPSVLGVQVAYAGYFASLVLEATGLSKIVKTP
jgi:hypothetical protein